MQTILQKLFSRKFLMTIGAVLAAITGTNLEGGQLFVVGLCAAAYVVAEAFTDRGRTEQLAVGVAQGIDIGRSADPNALSADEILHLRTALATARPSNAPPGLTASSRPSGAPTAPATPPPAFTVKP